MNIVICYFIHRQSNIRSTDLNRLNEKGTFLSLFCIVLFRLQFIELHGLLIRFQVRLDQQDDYSRVDQFSARSSEFKRIFEY